MCCGWVVLRRPGAWCMSLQNSGAGWVQVAQACFNACRACHCMFDEPGRQQATAMGPLLAP